MNDKEFIQYGKDNLTFSINLQKNKTEDWMSDWSGRVVIDGKTYFLNGYIKNEGWIAGKIKPSDQNQNKNNESQSNQNNKLDIEDEPPF